MNGYSTDFLTLEEVAEGIHISERTLRNKLSKGDENLPPSFRVGRRRLFPRKDFENWLYQVRLSSLTDNQVQSYKEVGQ